MDAVVFLIYRIIGSDAAALELVIYGGNTAAIHEIPEELVG